MEPIEELAENFPTTREQRRWLMGLGLLLTMLGLVALFASFAATLTTVFLFGALLLVGGIAQLAHALSPRTQNVGWELFGGLLYALAGGLLLLDPVSGAVGLTLLLAAFFLAMGVLRITLGLRLPERRGVRRSGLLWTGSIDFALGLLIVFGWPEISLWMIGIFLGIELVFAGLSLLSLSSAPGQDESTA